MIFVQRSQWGAQPANYQANKLDYPVSEWVVHHSVTGTGGANPHQVVRNIQAYHLSQRTATGKKKYADIAYNHLVANDTDHVFDGRGPFVVSGATSPELNPISLAVCAIGNFQQEAPSAALLSNLARLGADLVRNGFLHPQFRISGHRDHWATACCGDQLYRKLPAVRTAIAKILNPPTLPPPNLTLDQRVSALELRVTKLEAQG